MLVHGPEKTGHCWFSSKAILFFSPVGLPIGITFIYFAPRLVHRFEVLGETFFFISQMFAHRNNFLGGKEKVGESEFSHILKGFIFGFRDSYPQMSPHSFLV